MGASLMAYCAVPLSRALIVPTSPPPTSDFMVTAKRKFTLRVNFTGGSPTDRDIVDATIAFVNGAKVVIVDTLGPDDWTRGPLTPNERKLAEESLTTWKKLVYGDQPRPSGSVRSAGGAELLETEYRTVHRDFLAWLLRDSGAVARRYAELGIASQFLVEVYLHAAPDGFAITRLYRLDSYFKVLQVGIALLVDPEKRLLRKLCRCQLKSCGGFFFEIQPPTGRPQRKYCCSDHMLEAHRLDAPKRMKKFRKRAARPK
jgi:hypothetical protein